MGDRPQMLRAEDMATTSTAVTTVPPQLEEESVERVAVITLRPTRAQPRKKVVWTEDTVDNENMNKKKSKCCCIYEKPHRFDESSSSESEDECEHCFGHVERRHQRHAAGTSTATATATSTEVQDGATVEPTTTVSLKPPEPAPAPPDKSPADS